MQTIFNCFLFFFQLSDVEEENQRLYFKIKHLETELSFNLKEKQSLSPNGNTTLVDTRSNMRARITSIPIDEKTGELIPPRSPKLSPRRSAPFSPTISLLGSKNNSPSRRYSPTNKNNNSNEDELTEIQGIDSITDQATDGGKIGETPSDVHKDTETVKSKTCAIM